MQDFQFERLPLFESLKKGTYKKLREYVEFRMCAAGDTIVRQGELSEEFYILIKGIVTVYRAEEDGSVITLGNLGAGDWFGEMSALSHQPRFANVKADVPCVLLEIPPTLFHVLYNDRNGSFERLINKQYRERALAIHLRRAPLFKVLPDWILDRLAREAELVDFGPDEVIIESGADADAVYLVRSGAVKRVRREDGREEVEAYLCDNSSFGEHAFAEVPRLAVAFVAMARVDAVCVPKKLLDECIGEDTGLRETIASTVRVLLAEAAGEVLETDQRQDRVATEARKGNEALVIDLNRCTRCNVCVESCVAVHDDRVPRLSKRGIRSGDYVLTSACYNCQIPECMLACKFGAIRRDIHGNINFIFDNCTGCAACETKCPYGVIRMADFLAPQAAAPLQVGVLSRLPVLGRFFRRARGEGEEAEKGQRKAIKCDLCAGLPFEACVYNCPCNAIERIDASTLFS